MTLTRQQLAILAGLLLGGYLVACAFGYLVGTAPASAPVLAPRPAATRRPTVAPRPTPTPGNVIEIVRWNWYESATGNFIHVDGVVKNVSSGTVRRVKIHVELQDAKRKLLATDWDYADLDVLAPGQESTFGLMTRNRPGTQWVVIKSTSWKWQ